MKNNTIPKILLFIIFVITIESAAAFPVVPSQFYGEITVDDNLAKIGTEVLALDGDGVICGSFKIETEGEYIISCKGDKSDTEEDEGAVENEPIFFYVDGEDIGPRARWHEGGFLKLNLKIKSENETANLDIASPPSSNNLYLTFLFAGFIIFVFFKINKREVDENI